MLPLFRSQLAIVIYLLFQVNIKSFSRSKNPRLEGLLRLHLVIHYSWASHVAQLVKNLPAMQETLVGSMGWEDPLEKGKANPLYYSGL